MQKYFLSFNYVNNDRSGGFGHCIIECTSLDLDFFKQYVEKQCDVQNAVILFFTKLQDIKNESELDYESIEDEFQEKNS